PDEVAEEGLDLSELRHDPRRDVDRFAGQGPPDRRPNAPQTAFRLAEPDLDGFELLGRHRSSSSSRSDSLTAPRARQPAVKPSRKSEATRRSGTPRSAASSRISS